VSFRLGFFLLVFANLIFFVWAVGYLGGTDEGREPQRLMQQLHPEQLRVVQNPADSAWPPAPSAPSTPPAAVNAPVGSVTPAALATPSASPAATPPASPLPKTPTASASP